MKSHINLKCGVRHLAPLVVSGAKRDLMNDGDHTLYVMLMNALIHFLKGFCK